MRDYVTIAILTDFQPFFLKENRELLCVHLATQRYSCILDGHMLTKNVLRAAFGRPKSPIIIRYDCCGQRPQH